MMQEGTKNIQGIEKSSNPWILLYAASIDVSVIT